MWKRFDIIKTKRKEWIKDKAYAMVVDHETKFRLKLTDKEFNNFIAAAAESIAEQYTKVS
jgi:hypothetical protein